MNTCSCFLNCKAAGTWSCPFRPPSVERENTCSCTASLSQEYVTCRGATRAEPVNNNLLSSIQYNNKTETQSATCVGRNMEQIVCLLYSHFSACKAVSKHVWHIPLLCVQWKTPDDGQRNYPKHVEFYSKNKFEKLVHLVGFIIWITSGNNKIINNISDFYTVWRSTLFRMYQLHLLCDWICVRWMMKCLWFRIMDTRHGRGNSISSIWKENLAENIWTSERKWFMENSTKRWIRSHNQGREHFQVY